MPLADDHNTVLEMKFYSVHMQCQNYAPCSPAMSHHFLTTHNAAVYASARGRG